MYGTNYNCNGSKLNITSKGTLILNHIRENNGATKYSCITEILCIEGSKSRLRGYYSCTFRGWMDHGLLNYNPANYEYSLTSKGHSRLIAALNRI